jgi:hypothetical protein
MDISGTYSTYMVFLLKAAYGTAIIPRTLVNIAAKFCTVSLDHQIQTFKEAKEENRPTPSPTITYCLVHYVLQRYSEKDIASVVQRESLAVFFGSLLIALAVSCCFWGLVGLGVMQTDKHSLDAYEFFNSNTFGEAVLWAWGCMTTTIDFPGRIAPIWLKCLHAGILVTGLSQLRPSKLTQGACPLFGPPHRRPEPINNSHYWAIRPGQERGQRIWPKNGVFGQPNSN